MLEKFGTSRARDASVQLTHSGRHAHTHTHTSTKRGSMRRHPVKNLYSAGGVRYSAVGTPWACASAFLGWEWVEPGGSSRLRRRGGVVLNERGRWVILSDTDSGVCGNWFPFERPASACRMVTGDRIDHQYHLDRAQASLRYLPTRIFLMEP